MGYDNPLQDEYESSRHNEGPWCDDCHGYTHMPWCSEYVEPEVWVSHFDSRHRKGEPCNQCASHGQPASAMRSEQSQLFPRYSFAVVTGRYKILDNRSDGPVRITQIATADGEAEARTIVNALNANADDAQLRFLGNRAEELSSLLAGMTTERDELREVLRQLRAMFFEHSESGGYMEKGKLVKLDNEQHPWIPGAEAPRAIETIDAALNHAKREERKAK